MIPMEKTIDNLKLLDSSEYDMISVQINELVIKKQSNTVKVDDALNFGEKMCEKYSDAFKVLAN